MKFNKVKILLLVVSLALIAYPVLAGPPFVSSIGGSGSGDVTGPASSTDGYVVLWDGVGGDTLKDSTVNPSTLVIGPGSATDGYVALFDGATGKLLKDGVATSSFEPADAEIAKKDEVNTWAELQTFSSGIKTGPSSEPTDNFYDDETVGDISVSRIKANATDVTEGAEIADAWWQILISGAWVTVLNIDGDGNVGFTNKDQAIPDGKGLLYDDTPGSDLTGTGDIASMTVDENSVGVTCALHMDTDGNWIEADADTASGADMPCQALALETGTGTKKVLLRGFIRNDAWTWTVGGLIYVSTTTGTLTQTAPSSADDRIQIVGFATHADRMFFNPSYSMIVYAE
jgi:hypothetical protein